MRRTTNSQATFPKLRNSLVILIDSNNSSKCQESHLIVSFSWDYFLKSNIPLDHIELFKTHFSKWLKSLLEKTEHCFRLAQNLPSSHFGTYALLCAELHSRSEVSWGWTVYEHIEPKIGRGQQDLLLFPVIFPNKQRRKKKKTNALAF